MKEIPLRNRHGDTIAFALVDDADYTWLSQWKWCLVSQKYAARTITNPEPIGPRQIFIFMHKLIMGASSDEQVDHRNRCKLDNQRDNLRKCTHVQNQLNKPKLSCGKGGKLLTSQYKGVHWRKARNRWEVNVQVDGKQIYIGRFRKEDEIKAAVAYDAAARNYHGDFASTNF